MQTGIKLSAQRNNLIDNLRGLCMLGVVAIHIGSFVMTSATPSEHIYMFFQILSRYSVPTFFFISGYGLFAKYGLDKELHYSSFILKRFKSVGIPYIIWSLLYLLYYEKLYPGSIIWTLGAISFTLFWGVACYQLYFMVILLWFYASFPLWRKLMAVMSKYSLAVGMTLLFFLQMLFHYASANFWIYPAWIANSVILTNFFNYRLNYLPLFYLYIFMLGGVIALHYQKFITILKNKLSAITIFFLATSCIMAGSFYNYYYNQHLEPDTITGVLQQLSPEGFLYTNACILFFCAILLRLNTQNIGLKFINLFTEHSLIIYLIHPFFMSDTMIRLTNWGINFNQIPVLIFYCFILFESILASMLIKKLGTYCAPLALLLTGKSH